ncbi:MAG: DNA methyltransferase [Bryobacterales bacterium]|nr:DNA methyltransferase [Bryobacterales bacterium]MDE0623782.1 DNA methyltransferase [Bryobacterales bacterium]
MTLNLKNRTLFTGDNLDVLRGINSECVDLVYLDPPFNSNRNYEAPIGSEAAGAAFKDSWTLSDVDLAWHGLIAEKEPALATIIESAGLAHGKGMQAYLTMMAVRLVELRRVLKRSGSIYLHCDPTASHYLKLLMDCVFGQGNFRSEIVWKRSSAHNDAKQGRRQHGRIHDAVLFYSMSDRWTWNLVYTDYDDEYVKRFYRHVEEGTGRRYRLSDITGRGGAAKGNPMYEVMGVTRYWAYSRERMDELIAQGRIVQTAPGRVPAYKRYLDEMPGVTLQDMWTDIRPIASQAKERVGYPTQKPLALLERIIKASSNEGDVVLDPFCGCATALVAAETYDRQWVGIDLSSLAAKLVKQRLRKGGELFYEIHHRTDIPQRTDVGKLPPYKTHRHTLYGKQEGKCAGCGHHFPFQNFTVDHIVPRSKGGTDHLENLQLLCNYCNSTKGTLDQATFMAKLKQQGMV